MTKTDKHSILIILVSGVLVALLFNIKTLFWILDMLAPSGTNDVPQKIIDAKMLHCMVSIVFHVLVFYLIAFFNYSWKDLLLSRRMLPPLRALSILLLNILVFYLFATLETALANNHLGEIIKAGEGYSPDYYLFLNLSTGVAAAAVGYLVRMMQRSRSAELENMQLRQEKASAELAVLKEQISPHFFFNTLNSLSSVIRTREKEESLDFVQRMSDVYRYILDSESKDTVPLAEELAFLNAYIHLLGKRFGKNLTVSITIDEVLKRRLIPPLALQVLLENAVKHNIISAETPLRVSIASEGDFITVENNITGTKEQAGHGVGLANLNKRCKMIVGSEIEIQMDSSRFLVKLPLAPTQTNPGGSS